MKVLDHRLHSPDGTPTTYKKSPNQSGTIEPKFLVLHYTAGPSAKRAVQTLTNPSRKASAHLVIGRDGEVTQLVDFDKRAWHAGKSSWKGHIGLNKHSIGIELSNPGRLKRTATGWSTWFGEAVEPANVIEARHRNGGPIRGWHTYTPEQLDALTQASETLFDTYGLTEILGHEDIAPVRKSDPGPAFPMAELRALLLGREEDTPDDSPYDDSDIWVVGSRLNIRAEASTAGAKLPGSPLRKGTKVAVVGEQGVWRRVDVLEATGDDNDLEGWVHGRYLSRG